MTNFFHKTSNTMSKTFKVPENDEDDESLDQSSPISKEAHQTKTKLNAPSLKSETNGSNDRLIQSISMIKEILMSNMQLRDEHLKMAEQHDQTIQQNYQLNIENEDLRDRLYLLT